MYMHVWKGFILECVLSRNKQQVSSILGVATSKPARLLYTWMCSHNTVVIL